MSNININFKQFPNFLIVGANKAGTTSIHSYCNQHPQIFMSKVKEPMFFTASPELAKRNRANKQNKTMTDHLANPQVITSIEDYQNLFVGGENAIARGEASTSYLAIPDKAIPKIKSMFPHMKIIACLRDPIDRAFSCYCMYHGAGIEKRSFEQAVADEIEGKLDGIPSGRRYLTLGLYYWPLKKYLQAFGEKQVLILLFDNLKNNPTAFMKEIFTFLGVDDDFIPSTKVKLNTSEDWLKDREKEKMTPEALSMCQSFFAEDLEKLKELVSLDDVSWANARKAVEITPDNSIIKDSFDRSREKDSQEYSKYCCEVIQFNCLDNDLLYGWNIDNPKSGMLDSHLFSGWIIGKKSSVVSIELRNNNQLLKSISINVNRPDVREEYSSIIGAESSGFRTSLIDILNEHELLDFLEIIAVFENQEKIPLGRINLIQI